MKVSCPLFQHLRGLSKALPVLIYISPVRMAARQMLNQLKQQIQASIIQKFTIFQQQITHELNSIKDFIDRQDTLNSHQQDSNKKLEADISILKLLCLQQSEKVQHLKNMLGNISEEQNVVANIESQKTLNQKGTEQNQFRRHIVRQNSTKTENKLQNPFKQIQHHFRESVPVMGSFFSHNSPPKKLEELPPVDSVSNSQSPRLRPFAGGQMNIQLRDALMMAGEDFRNSKKYKESLNYYFQANEVCEKLKEEQMNVQGEVLFWIASNYSQLGDHSEAIRYYKEELAIRKIAKEMSSQNVAATLNNIGHNYYLKKEYRKAVQYFESAIEMQIKVKGQHNSSVGLYLKNLGQVHYNLGNHPSAEKCCSQALNILERVGEGSTQIAAWCHFYIAGINCKAKRYAETAKNILDSLTAHKIQGKRDEFKEMLRATIKHGGHKGEVSRLSAMALRILSEDDHRRQEQEQPFILI